MLEAVGIGDHYVSETALQELLGFYQCGRRCLAGGGNRAFWTGRSHDEEHWLEFRSPHPRFKPDQA